ncbi:MAG: Trp family transcriptional regulator [Candidatus Paceibacterota bacterium]|jgi:uncharacterized protein YerC
MTNISKKNFDGNLKIKAWDRLFEVIKNSPSSEALISSIRTFLTPSEIAMIEKRLLILVLLEQKLSYRAIGKMLDVSPATISFVKHNLTKAPVIHKKYSIMKKSETLKDLWPLMSPAEHTRQIRRKMKGY